MGLQIKKMLGWGLTDITSSKDKRFKVSLDDLNEIANNIQKTNEFINTMKEKYKEYTHVEQLDNDYSIVTLCNTNTNHSEIDCFFVFDPEFGLKNVFVIKPMVGHDDWYRNDDIIDYEDANANGKDKCKKLNRNIYPYYGYIDVITKKQLPKYNNLLSLIAHNKNDVSSEIIKYHTEGLYSTLNEVKENVGFNIPQIIHEYFEYFDVFKDKNDQYRLKPLLYTWWS